MKKSSKKYRWAGLIALLVVIVVIIKCFPQNKVEEKGKVIFGISPFPDTYMPYLGLLKGWYAEEGLDVEFRILGWTEIQEALSSGSVNKIDVGINNMSSVIATYNRNPELVYFYGFNTFDDGFALMMRPDDSLHPLSYFLSQGLDRETALQETGKQLKGKTVITTSNTDMEQGVAALALKGGLDFLHDIRIINLNAEDGMTAFISGEGDAYIGGIPQRNKLKQAGMEEIITGTDLGPAPINGFVTTRHFVEKNSDVLLKLLHVWFRIVNYTNFHLDEVAALMTIETNRYTGTAVTPEEFKAYWNHYEHYPSSPKVVQEQILNPEGQNYWKARWDDCNYYFYTIKKAIPIPVSADDAFYMKEAQRLYIEKYGDNGRNDD